MLEGHLDHLLLNPILAVRLHTNAGTDVDSLPVGCTLVKYQETLEHLGPPPVWHYFPTIAGSRFYKRTTAKGFLASYGAQSPEATALLHMKSGLLVRAR